PIQPWATRYSLSVRRVMRRVVHALRVRFVPSLRSGRYGSGRWASAAAFGTSDVGCSTCGDSSPDGAIGDGTPGATPTRLTPRDPTRFGRGDQRILLALSTLGG